MNKKTRRGFIVFVVIMICMLSFWLGSKLFQVETVINVNPDSIPAAFEQEQDSVNQTETMPHVIVHRMSNAPHANTVEQPVNRSSDTWSNIKTEKLTRNDAEISGDLSLNPAVPCVENGFYFGTSPDALSKNEWWDPIEGVIGFNNEEVTVSFFLSRYGQKLKPGTTYYFKLYIIDEYGNEYTSDIKSFTTYE